MAVLSKPQQLFHFTADCIVSVNASCIGGFTGPGLLWVQAAIMTFNVVEFSCHYFSLSLMAALLQGSALAVLLWWLHSACS